MDILRAAGEVQRLLDALVVETVASVDSRPEGPRERSFAATFGCRNMNELLQRALRVDAAGAGRVVKAAKAVHRQTGLTTGDPLPALWPQLREAMLDGVIGLSGLLAATGPIDQAGRRVGTEERWRADAQLAAFARGCAIADLAGVVEVEDDVSAADRIEVSGPSATPDDLRLFAQVIATYLDPDGAEPANEKAMREPIPALRAGEGRRCPGPREPAPGCCRTVPAPPRRVQQPEDGRATRPRHRRGGVPPDG